MSGLFYLFRKKLLLLYFCMRATTIILAAGQGNRLKPLTENTPKCLLKVGGLPILHRQIESLQKHGIKDIIIVVGFMSEMVKNF